MGDENAMVTVDREQNEEAPRTGEAIGCLNDSIVIGRADE
jgi:hypothetical protein